MEIFNSGKTGLFGMALWDNEFIFVGCNDKTVKLIEIKSGKILKRLIGHSNIPEILK